jgi:hypothetical protein
MAMTSTTVQQIDPAQVAAFKAKLAQLKKIRPGAATNIAMGRGNATLLR